jgi:hypothetical protein
LVSRRDPGHGFIRGGTLKIRGRSGAAPTSAHSPTCHADRCVLYIARLSLRSLTG